MAIVIVLTRRPLFIFSECPGSSFYKLILDYCPCRKCEKKKKIQQETIQLREQEKEASALIAVSSLRVSQDHNSTIPLLQFPEMPWYTKMTDFSGIRGG